jgi:hypothetical protein
MAWNKEGVTRESQTRPLLFACQGALLSVSGAALGQILDAREGANSREKRADSDSADQEMYRFLSRLLIECLEAREMTNCKIMKQNAVLNERRRRAKRSTQP